MSPPDAILNLTTKISGQASFIEAFLEMLQRVTRDPPLVCNLGIHYIPHQGQWRVESIQSKWVAVGFGGTSSEAAWYCMKSFIALAKDFGIEHQHALWDPLIQAYQPQFDPF